MKHFLLTIAVVLVVACKVEKKGPEGFSTVIDRPNSSEAKAAINAAIRKAAGEPLSPLTKADLERVTILQLGGNNISDLSPLMGLTQLRELQLNNNQISDLTSLKGLKHLEKLILDNNKIIDVGPLKELKQLKELFLNYNHISDLAPLKELKQLKVLYIEANYKAHGAIRGDLTLAEVEKLQKALPNCRISEFNARR